MTTKKGLIDQALGEADEAELVPRPANETDRAELARISQESHERASELVHEIAQEFASAPVMRQAVS